ncbi:MAG: fibronectin type III domain-containing protein [Euryarchaeota archaeon]|nr:fibronectin type III domain-containing protein [Euryarchaeota archaeon]
MAVAERGLGSLAGLFRKGAALVVLALFIGAVPPAVASEDPSPPGAPLALIGVSGVDDTMVLSWQAPVDDGGAPVLEYRLYKAVFPNGFTYLGTSETTTFIDEVSLDSTTLVSYTVTAVNEAGESENSGPCVLVVLSVPPSVTIDLACLPVPCDPLVCLLWPAICIPPC